MSFNPKFAVLAVLSPVISAVQRLMGLVWQTRQGDTVYEVRRHGRTLRLYANGVQHSEYHPERLVTTSVWDLLWLPILFDEPTRYQRILVLGLGGGSIIAPLVELARPGHIEAVDLDPVHIEVAQRFFGVADHGVICHCANAVTFVEDYLAAGGEPFDLVIEDLFAPHDRTVSRAVPATGQWLGKLGKLVRPDGMLVMNFGDWPEYRQSWAAGERALRGWAERHRLATPDCHNAVIAFRRTPGDSAELRHRVRDHTDLAKALDKGKLLYSIRRLD